MNHQLLSKFTNELGHLYEASEIEVIFSLCDEFIQTGDDNISEKKFSNIEDLLTELKTGKPIQYILGQAYFWDRNFQVNENTLIPRPETEELLYWIKNWYANTQIPNSILDMGTGTGCIPIILKSLYHQASVSAIDIDENTLATAQNNSIIHKLPVDFHQDNILAINSKINNQKWDLIVSNPPYIMPFEAKEMHQNVLEFEPSKALFVTNNDPLQFYKAIADFGVAHLNESGNIFAELNPLFAKEIEQYFIDLGYQTEIKLDMQYKQRMLRANK